MQNILFYHQHGLLRNLWKQKITGLRTGAARQQEGHQSRWCDCVCVTCHNAATTQWHIVRCCVRIFCILSSAAIHFSFVLFGIIGRIKYTVHQSVNWRGMERSKRLNWHLGPVKRWNQHGDFCFNCYELRWNFLCSSAPKASLSVIVAVCKNSCSVLCKTID